MRYLASIQEENVIILQAFCLMDCREHHAGLAEIVSKEVFHIGHKALYGALAARLCKIRLQERMEGINLIVDLSNSDLCIFLVRLGGYLLASVFFSQFAKVL